MERGRIPLQDIRPLRTDLGDKLRQILREQRPRVAASMHADFASLEAATLRRMRR